MNAPGKARPGAVVFAAAAIAAVVLATAAIDPPAPAGAAAGPSPTESCTWKRHSKRVVKRVRRHGKVRRVRRMKHWWACQTQPAVPPADTALPAAPAAEAPSPGEPESQIGRLGVKAVEYSYTLSRPQVAAGEVIVELNNQGEDPHNLRLEREGSADPELEIPATGSLTQAKASFTLSAGTWRLYCSLYSHESKGMQATLVVGG